MDFLDPKRKRAHRHRLFIGYALMSIVVALGTMVILYLAYGYDIDRKTGDVIQNGIVFVDSQPSGADVFLNGIRQGSRTDTRMVLPAGAYTIRLESEGYRTWERTFNLDGGEIQRLVYPYLIPTKPVVSEIAQLETAPQFVTQSPDRRWILAQRPGQGLQFDMYDLRDADKAPVLVTVPTTVLTSPTLKSAISLVEWSSNNKHFIINRTAKGVSDFIRVDREQPQTSVNINTLLGIKPVVVTLRDKHPERIYFLDAVPGVLRSADLKSGSLSSPLASGVLEFKPHGGDVVLYASRTEKTVEGKVDFKILEKSTSYSLRSMNSAKGFVLDVSRFDDKWFYVVGSTEDGIAYIYENPLPALKQEIPSPLIVSSIMRLKDQEHVSFSKSAQFIALQSDKQVLTIDLFDQRQYLVSLKHDVPDGYQVTWMDGYRLRYTIKNKAYIIDYDGSNEQQLIASETATGPFFDMDFENLYSFGASEETPDKSALWLTDLRL